MSEENKQKPKDSLLFKKGKRSYADDAFDVLEELKEKKTSELSVEEMRDRLKSRGYTP